MLGAVILGIGANAQTLTFKLGGQTVEPGTTAVFEGGDKYEVPGVMATWNCAPEFTVTPSASGTIDVVGKSLTGDEFQMCCNGGCTPGTLINKPGINVTANDPYDLVLEFIGTQMGEDAKIPQNAVIEISAQYNGKPETLTKCNVKFFADGSGVISVVDAKSSLNTLNGALEYSVESPATLNLYSTDGTTVISTEVNGNGSVSTSGLAKGIYLYTLGAKSGKIVVK